MKDVNIWESWLKITREFLQYFSNSFVSLKLFKSKKLKGTISNYEKKWVKNNIQREQRPTFDHVVVCIILLFNFLKKFQPAVKCPELSDYNKIY